VLAWYMCDRLRAGLRDENFRKLMGVAEADETYIGGKNANRHWDKKTSTKLATRRQARFRLSVQSREKAMSYVG